MSNRFLLKKIAIIVAILIVVLLGYAATRPDTFRVERATSIKAPPEKIFALVNDLRSHGLWSPWEKKDPAMKRTYSGATSGEGAVYEWEATRTSARGAWRSRRPLHRPARSNNFIKPFAAQTPWVHAEIEGFDARHAVDLHSPISQLFGLFCNMDKMIGEKFEQAWPR
jgi:hypothetical protein